MREGLEIKLEKHASELWGKAKQDGKWRQDETTIVHKKHGTRMRMLPGGKWKVVKP